MLFPIGNISIPIREFNSELLPLDCVPTTTNFGNSINVLSIYVELRIDAILIISLFYEISKGFA